jgi:hypothetical protein
MSLRCQYQANVMKTFESVSRANVVTVGMASGMTPGAEGVKAEGAGGENEE